MFTSLSFVFFSLMSVFLPSNHHTEGMEIIAPEGCKRQPIFASKLGFNLSKSAFSTSEKKKKGLVFIEINSDKSYQHESWSKFGNLGPIIVTEKGDAFTAPVASVNVLGNQADDQNNIYKVASETGEMTLFTSLPRATKPNSDNPFGILGLAYDCDTKIIYISTVFGSTPKKEEGRIYALQSETGKIIDSLTNIDVMGIGVGYNNNERTLFLGSTRESHILSVKLDNNGHFLSKKPVLAASIEGLGQRGDDRVRKIRFSPNGEMMVQGAMFYYNLTAPSERQETMYYFKFDSNQKQWIFAGYGN